MVKNAHVSNLPTVQAVSTKPLDQFHCPHAGCPEFGKPGRGNIVLYTRYSRKQVRLLQCKTCGQTFSELKNTPLWDSRLDFRRIAAVFTLLVSGESIRGTARSVPGDGASSRLSKNTVKRYLRLAIERPEETWAAICEHVLFRREQFDVMLDLQRSALAERTGLKK